MEEQARFEGIERKREDDVLRAETLSEGESGRVE